MTAVRVTPNLSLASINLSTGTVQGCAEGSLTHLDGLTCLVVIDSGGSYRLLRFAAQSVHLSGPDSILRAPDYTGDHLLIYGSAVARPSFTLPMVARRTAEGGGTALLVSTSGLLVAALDPDMRQNRRRLFRLDTAREVTNQLLSSYWSIDDWELGVINATDEFQLARAFGRLGK